IRGDGPPRIEKYVQIASDEDSIWKVSRIKYFVDKSLSWIFWLDPIIAETHERGRAKHLCHAYGPGIRARRVNGKGSYPRRPVVGEGKTGRRVFRKDKAITSGCDRECGLSSDCGHDHDSQGEK